MKIVEHQIVQYLLYNIEIVKHYYSALMKIVIFKMKQS